MRHIITKLIIIQIFTALFVWMAYKERGYFAIGLEYFLTPIIVGGWIKLQEIKKESTYKFGDSADS